MSLMLELHPGEKIYLMGPKGVICEIMGIEVIGGNKMSVAFSLCDDVEIIRRKLLEKIIREKGRYSYPAMRKYNINEVQKKVLNLEVL